MKTGILIVISGPSGVGKGTIIEALLKENTSLAFSISVTTRPPRPNETNGAQYYFVTKEEFEKKIKGNEFLEWARVHDHYYGTPRDGVRKGLAEGKDIVLDIDVQGGMQVKKTFPDGVFVFIVPPTFEELRRRLLSRNTDDEQSIEKRLQDAREELRHMKEYDYLVVNDRLPEAVSDVKAVIRAEMCKQERRFQEIKNALSPS